MMRWTVVVALVAGAVAYGAAASGASTRPPCGPPSATTLASNSRARIYVTGDAVDGCATGTARPTRLGGAGPCPERRGGPRAGPVALAGSVAAAALETCGVDVSSAEIAVTSLSTSRRLSAHPAITELIGAESFQSVGSIAVRTNGSVAWIASESSIATHRRLTVVMAVAGGRVHELDSGSAINAQSLRFAGGRLRWRDGSRTRSGPW